MSLTTYVHIIGFFNPFQYVQRMEIDDVRYIRANNCTDSCKKENDFSVHPMLVYWPICWKKGEVCLTLADNYVFGSLFNWVG